MTFTLDEDHEPQLADVKASSLALVAGGDLIFGLDIDASAYRILLNERAHVVIVGIGLPAGELVERLQEICHRGEDSPLPSQVVITLALRHEQFATQPGTRFERRAQL